MAMTAEIIWQPLVLQGGEWMCAGCHEPVSARPGQGEVRDVSNPHTAQPGEVQDYGIPHKDGCRALHDMLGSL
jgi:hypothetical protein